MNAEPMPSSSMSPPPGPSYTHHHQREPAQDELSYSNGHNDDYYTDAPYNDPYTTTDSEGKYRSQGRSHPSSGRRSRKSSTSKRGLVRILLEEKLDGENVKIQLEQAYAYIRAESQRANEAERILQEAKERIRGLLQARTVAQQQAERAQAELRMYKVQYENSQAQMQRANEMIAESDLERNKAQRQVEKMKEALEKYKEAELTRRAREEGWRAGREEGYRTAQAQAEAAMRTREAMADEEYEDDYGERNQQRQEPPRVAERSMADQQRSSNVVEPPPPIPSQPPGPHPLTTENVEAFSTPRSGPSARDEYRGSDGRPVMPPGASDIVVHPAPPAQPEPMPVPVHAQTPPAVPIPPPAVERGIAMPMPRPRPDHIIVRSPLDATPVYPHTRPLSRASTLNARSIRQSMPPPEDDEDSESSQSSCPTPVEMIRPLSSTSRRTNGTHTSSSRSLGLSGVPHVQTTTPAPGSERIAGGSIAGGRVGSRGSMRSMGGYDRSAIDRMAGPDSVVPQPAPAFGTASFMPMAGDRTGSRSSESSSTTSSPRSRRDSARRQAIGSRRSSESTVPGITIEPPSRPESAGSHGTYEPYPEMLTPDGHAPQIPSVPVQPVMDRPSSRASGLRHSMVSESGLPVGFIPTGATPVIPPMGLGTPQSMPSIELPYGFVPTGVAAVSPDMNTDGRQTPRSSSGLGMERPSSRHSTLANGHGRRDSMNSLTSSLRRSSLRDPLNRLASSSQPFASSPLRHATTSERAPSRSGGATPVQAIYGPPAGGSQSRPGTVYPGSPSMSSMSGATTARGVPLPGSVFGGSSRPPSRHHTATPYRRPTEDLYADSE